MQSAHCEPFPAHASLHPTCPTAWPRSTAQPCWSNRAGLQAATKQFGSTILLSEDFVRMLSPGVRCAPPQPQPLLLPLSLPATVPQLLLLFR